MIRMKSRESSLPAGWYPRNADEIGRFLSDFPVGAGKARAAIAPHAGWYYSGKIAGRAVSSLANDVDTLVVIGGHLGQGYPPLFALEDAVKTPLGEMAIDAELRNALYDEINGQEDRYPDNTVEVLLPMARYFFPDISLLWLRLPAEISSYQTGVTLANTAKKLGRSIAVLGSTDLTHYGRNYGFTPRGEGRAALDWVKEVNDRRFIEAVAAGDPSAVLERAQTEYSSCSAGAVLGVMGFASEEKLDGAQLLEYGTSADVSGGGDVPDSFVGYAAFV